jgi:hypothetical protein
VKVSELYHHKEVSNYVIMLHVLNDKIKKETQRQSEVVRYRADQTEKFFGSAPVIVSKHKTGMSRQEL